MGLCTSCDALAVVQSSTTKLILADGTLLEFSRPVRAGSALNDKSFDSDRWFVCDIDEMEFDGFVSAVGSDEWLRPGQIYFVLPDSMLKSPLQAEDLAKLAVRASSALMKSSAAPLTFEPKAADVVVPTVVGRRRKMRSGSGRGRKFASDLSAIPE